MWRSTIRQAAVRSLNGKAVGFLQWPKSLWLSGTVQHLANGSQQRSTSLAGAKLHDDDEWLAQSLALGEVHAAAASQDGASGANR